MRVAVPARYQIGLQIDDPDRVTSNGIHAVVTRWLDNDESNPRHRNNSKRVPRPVTAERPESGPDHHDTDKPYSVTPLFSTPEATHVFEVGILVEEITERLLLGAARGAVRFGNLSVGAAQRSVSLVATQEWDALSEAAPTSRWTFEFVEPVAFRQRKRYLPLPEPGSVFGHLRKAWNLWAPSTMDLDFKEVGLVKLSQTGKVETRRIRDETAVGFVGQVTYAARSPEPEHLRKLTALAHLAEFSGVGSRTTYGLGVTRVG